MGVIGLSLRDPIVSLSVWEDGSRWTMRFTAKSSSYLNHIGLSTGGDLLSLPGELQVSAGASDKGAVGSIHHWPALKGESGMPESFYVQCMIPADQFRELLTSTERGRPPLDVSLTIPDLSEFKDWDVTEHDTWKAISSLWFGFDERAVPYEEEDIPSPVEPAPKTDVHVMKAVGELTKIATYTLYALIAVAVVLIFRR